MTVKKTPRTVLTFPTTTDAIRFEKAAHEWKYAGRMIPVPREISAGCGLAFSAPTGKANGLKRMAERMKINVEGIYEIAI